MGFSGVLIPVAGMHGSDFVKDFCIACTKGREEAQPAVILIFKSQYTLPTSHPDTDFLIKLYLPSQAQTAFHKQP